MDSLLISLLAFSQSGNLTLNHSFILSGELHDIFVGLMGRRNSESGERVCFVFLTKSDGFPETLEFRNQTDKMSE